MSSNSRNNFIKISWSIKDLFKIFFLIITVSILLYALIPIKKGRFEPFYTLYIYSCVQLMIPTLYFKYKKVNVYELLFNRNISLKKALIIGAATGFLLIIISYLFRIEACLNLFNKRNIIFRHLPIILFSLFNRNTLLIGFIAPLSEEFFLRGILYTTLRKYMNFITALIICSFVAMLLHLPLLNYLYVLDVFFKVAVYTFLFEKYKTLFPSVFSHIGNNFINDILVRSIASTIWNGKF